jgi:two-component system CheB/CheR fusion protein
VRLSELDRKPGRHMTVDLFFRSLADTHGPHATAIVLSGGDGDGAIGIKRIKERGGLTVAQDPDAAEHAGMPRAAIDTGMVDWVLRAEDIPARLLDYSAREKRLDVPPEVGPNPAVSPRPSLSNQESALREVLSFLRARTGRDFSYYKRATIVRRVSRRMQVNQVDNLQDYLGYLRTHPGEAGALLQDLLISVTNFFRDREAFEALERTIPDLFRNKSQADSVRVWVPACATGEEAYSIAMLLTEHARALDSPPSLQIFATDLDEDVLAEARNGAYPEAIATDVSPERLRRFFVKEHNGYRIRREIREMLLFAVHDLAERLAIFAAGHDFVPQPVDLPEPRRAAERLRHLSFRAASGGAALSRHLRGGRRWQPSVLACRQETSHLPGAQHRADEPAGAFRSELTDACARCKREYGGSGRAQAREQQPQLARDALHRERSLVVE